MRTLSRRIDFDGFILWAGLVAWIWARQVAAWDVLETAAAAIMAMLFVTTIRIAQMASR